MDGPEASVVIFDDGTSDGELQADDSAGRRAEHVKHPFDIAGRHASTAVFDFDRNLVWCRPHRSNANRRLACGSCRHALHRTRNQGPDDEP
jgi:hypothetical protein